MFFIRSVLSDLHSLRSSCSSLNQSPYKIGPNALLFSGLLEQWIESDPFQVGSRLVL